MNEIKENKTENAKEEVKPIGTEKVYATIDDFMKIEIKVGTVLSVNVVEGADKLYILSVDFGLKRPETDGCSPDHPLECLGEEKDIRQILSGIREYVQPEDLLGKQFPFVTNLAPRMLRGHESQGMILAGSDDDGLALLNPSKILVNGTRLR
jgi:methionyl-tRNA synthetase